MLKRSPHQAWCAVC